MAAGLGLWIEGPWRSGFQQGYVTNMVATSQLHGRRVGLGDLLEALWSSEKGLVGHRGASGGMERSWAPLGVFVEAAGA